MQWTKRYFNIDVIFMISLLTFIFNFNPILYFCTGTKNVPSWLNVIAIQLGTIMSTIANGTIRVRTDLRKLR